MRVVRQGLVLGLCGAALIAAGCGGGDDDDGSQSGQGATATPTTEGSGGTATPTATATAAAGGEPAGSPPTLAEQTGLKARGARTTTLDIAVNELSVHGELATLRVTYSVHDPEAEPDASFSLYDLNDQQPLYVSLIDPVNLKRYNVVADSDSHKLQSGEVETKVPLDDSTDAQYTFAAPPADVEEIDVAIGDWPTFRDVPIQR
jgi:hypothetical protein